MLEKDRKAAPEAKVRIERILVPFDFGEPAEHALRFGRQLAAKFAASVEVLYVVPLMPGVALPVPELGAIPLGAYSVDDMVADAEGRLAEALMPKEVGLTTSVKVGDPRAQIVAHAAAEGVDLIVMGTHGRTGASRFLLGSVAERVVREATCPVLTVH